MSSILRDHSDDVQLFKDSLGVKGEYRRTLKKTVKTVLGEKSSNDRNILTSLTSSKSESVVINIEDDHQSPQVLHYEYAVPTHNSFSILGN